MIWGSQMKDAIGDRMKERYENRTRLSLPRRTYTIIRVDGKAFHTFTKGFKRPFDTDLMNIMDQTAKTLCEQIQGAKLAYVQSDEISVLLTDFEKPTTDAWFDGNIQKIVSVSASIATAVFNKAYLQFKLNERADFHADCGECNERYEGYKIAMFDSRVFTIPDPVEVENYFIWRQQDASRNSVQMVARSLYSHKQCENKNNQQLQDMIHEAGQNWNDYPAGQKRGRIIVKETYEQEIPMQKDTVTRTRWIVQNPPIFTQDRDFLKSRIPRIGDEDAES